VLRRLLQLAHDKRGVDIAVERDFSTACRRMRSTKPWHSSSISIPGVRASLIGSR
jgi:hypothetical protein